MLAAVVSAGVVALEAALDAEDWQLLPEEEALAAQVVAIRRRELAAGRTLARRALAAAGAPAAPLLAGPGRAPRWPDGFTGSISHTRRWCGAVAAPTSRVHAIGIDGEHPIGDLDEAWIRRVCRPAERDWLEAATAGERAIRAALLFSAKESLHKARYPLAGAVLEHAEVEIAVDGRGGLSGRLAGRAPLAGEPAAWSGRYAVSSDLVVTAFEWSAGSPAGSIDVGNVS